MTPHEELIHDQGFRDGVLFCIQHLRVAADRVEYPTRGPFEKDGRTIQGIVKTGQPAYARKLRELADAMEKVISQ